MTASGGWIFRVKLSDQGIADIKGLRDVAMVTVFGITLAANGL